MDIGTSSSLVIDSRLPRSREERLQRHYHCIRQLSSRCAVVKNGDDVLICLLRITTLVRE